MEDSRLTAPANDSTGSAAGCGDLDRHRGRRRHRHAQPAACAQRTDTAMRAEIAAAFAAWVRDPQVYAAVIVSATDRAFCAGGDVREMVDWGKTRPKDARLSLAAEYSLNWQLDCFTKPTVSLIDGTVMGSGVGITLYGTHRVAGERYRFAMPETGIGLFPDDGVSWAFARMPDEVGMYLALTGRAIGRADAYRLGLVTHCLPAARFAEVRAAISDADPVDPVLDSRHEDPGLGEIDALRPAIARCFGQPSVEAIAAALAAERGETRNVGERRIGGFAALLADLAQGDAPTCAGGARRRLERHAEAGFPPRQPVHARPRLLRGCPGRPHRSRPSPEMAASQPRPSQRCRSRGLFRAAWCRRAAACHPHGNAGGPVRDRINLGCSEVMC